MRAIRRFIIHPVLPEQLAPLRELMLNLRWSWHTETRDLFAAIDPAAWQRAGGDPVALLAQVPPERLAVRWPPTGGSCASATPPTSCRLREPASPDSRPHAAYFSRVQLTAALPQSGGSAPGRGRKAAVTWACR